MEIEVIVTATTEVQVDLRVSPVAGRFPGPPDAPRYQFVFSDDLVLQRIDHKEPGTGLLESPRDRLAGTHSGLVTTLRVAGVNDPFFSEGSMVLQYEGTYLFDAPIPDLPTDLPRGQVVVRGVALLAGDFAPIDPLTFAIVGGTGAYVGASGQVVHSGSDGAIRTLTIV
jgi:hypothetical protein